MYKICTTNTHQSSIATNCTQNTSWKITLLNFDKYINTPDQDNLGASLLAGRPPYEADCWEPGRELTAERGGFEDTGKQTTRKGATEGGNFLFKYYLLHLY